MIFEIRQKSSVMIWLLYGVIVFGIAQILVSLWYIGSRGVVKTRNTNININFNLFGEHTNSTAAAEKTSDFEVYEQLNLSDAKLPLCGRAQFANSKVHVDEEIANMEKVEHFYSDVQYGGYYKPPNCTAQHRVAIIVPYRDRLSHLVIFLNHMHKFLQRQNIEYRVFIMEVTEEITFNRALLLNMGYTEANKRHNFTCFIFHDVDLLPENDNNLYICPKYHPKHFSVAVDKFDYKLPYVEIFGGVTGLTKEQFQRVNGYSNKYFGWGGEDDDMYRRIQAKNMTIVRDDNRISTYRMLRHGQDDISSVRRKLLRGALQRMETDGINSLKYRVLNTSNYKLYTHILCTINMSDTAYKQPQTIITYNDTFIFHPQHFYVSPFLLLFLTVLTGVLLAFIVSICTRHIHLRVSE